MSAIFPDFVVVRIATSRVWCTLCSKRNAGQQEPSSFSLCNLGTWSKMGTNSTRLSQATSDSLTDWSWSLGESQPTGHEIRKMGSNSQVRHWSGAQKDSHLEMAQSQKVGQGQDHKKDHWQQATEMDGSKWATAESSKSFNGRAPLFHHHHHLSSNIPFQKNYLVFHISGST